jgi:hypothetical protein
MTVEPKLLSTDELEALASANDVYHPFAWSPDHMGDEHYQLAEQAVGDVQLLLGHIAALESRPAISVSFPRTAFSRCAWCGTTRESDPGDTVESLFAIAKEHAESCTANPLRADLAQISAKLDECMLRGAAVIAERNRYKQDFCAMADRALELAAQVTQLELIRDELIAKVGGLRSDRTRERDAFLAGALMACCNTTVVFAGGSNVASVPSDSDIEAAAAGYLAAGDKT